jgi:hypothetical protein
MSRHELFQTLPHVFNASGDSPHNLGVPIKGTIVEQRHVEKPLHGCATASVKPLLIGQCAQKIDTHGDDLLMDLLPGALIVTFSVEGFDLGQIQKECMNPRTANGTGLCLTL